MFPPEYSWVNWSPWNLKCDLLYSKRNRNVCNKINHVLLSNSGRWYKFRMLLKSSWRSGIGRVIDLRILKHQLINWCKLIYDLDMKYYFRGVSFYSWLICYNGVNLCQYFTSREIRRSKLKTLFKMIVRKIVDSKCIKSSL